MMKSRLLFFIILVAGVTSIVVTTMMHSPSENHTVPLSISMNTPSESSYKLKMSFPDDGSQKKHPEKSDLMKFIPWQMDNALCVNLNSLRKFHWSISLFKNLKIQDIKRRFTPLGISMTNIDSVCLGFRDTSPVLSLSGKALSLILKPLVFILSGENSRLEALKNYWKKGLGENKVFNQGDFLMGFPDKSDKIAGAYKCDIKPLMHMINKSTFKYSICRDSFCKNSTIKLGIFPDISYAYRPQKPLRLTSTSRIASIFAGIELNPDGFILRVSVETVNSCNETIPRLKLWMESIFSRYRLNTGLPQRIQAMCNNNSLLMTLTLSSSEFFNQLKIVGLIDNVSFN
ncbi:MAG: hypothetical protein JXR95_07445 [Deltaproteobacteria bacterium]|nr:hypothetical protein [Deltaproteobacteria bacterium]